MTDQRSVHEPDAALLSAEDAIADADRLQRLYRQRLQTEAAIPLRVPLTTLLEALDQLEPSALREIARRIEERLAVHGAQ